MNPKFFLLFLIVLNLNQSIFAQKLTKEDCKCKIETSKKLLDGRIAEPHAHPFHVSLSEKSKPDESFCAGVILNHNQILTKGRCVLEKFLDVKNTIIRAGVHDLNSNEGEIYTIKKVYRDNRYTDFLNTLGDISLIETNEIIKFTDKIRPACIATKYEDYDGILVSIGWLPGKNGREGPNRALISDLKYLIYSGELREASSTYSKTFMNQDCRDHFICYKATSKNYIMNLPDGGSGLIHFKNGIKRVVGINRFTTHVIDGGALRISFYKPEIDKWTDSNYCSGDV